MDHKEIAERLQKAFDGSPYSYGDLSKLTGIPKSALQRYITGDTGKIPMDRLRTICEILGLDAAEVIGWDDPQSQSKTGSAGLGKPVYLKHDEVRIMARGFDRMPEEKRKKAFDLAKMIFSEYAEYFEEGADDDDA